MKQPNEKRFAINDRVEFKVVPPNQRSSAAKSETCYGTVVGFEEVHHRGVSMTFVVVKPEKVHGYWSRVNQLLKFTFSELKLAQPNA